MRAKQDTCVELRLAARDLAPGGLENGKSPAGSPSVRLRGARLRAVPTSLAGYLRGARAR